MMKYFTVAISLLISSSAQAEDISSVDMKCLALNSYFESRNQSPNGGIAVTHVVLNRVADKRYPSTICEVVKQGIKNKDGSIRRNKCQFSWYCDGLSDKPREPESWVDALNRTIVALELYKEGFDISHGSTHYHSKNVKPYWSKTIDYITTIDDHHFYKWGK
jgi:spore germination cell wall hydrolase CwlJ-like protein